ncbi:hypothetical protein DIPPA_08641 [Diplonema papillatum]|nr:hypothetical protein DIPPA_08641 [Diplonema papillatum]
MKVVPLLAAALVLAGLPQSEGAINRAAVVRRFNPVRTASSPVTPMMVGNGNFAFGADVTGMQTVLPFNTLSSWGWHNNSLPTTPGQNSTTDFTGVEWWTHGRLVWYDQANPQEPEISNWLVQNPQRVNLGRIGLVYEGRNITEDALSEKNQTLDLFSGVITSTFTLNGSRVRVVTTCHPQQDTVSFSIQSELIQTGKLAVFVDFPYTDVEKFEAPFVGDWSSPSSHSTSLRRSPASPDAATVEHTLGQAVYSTVLAWAGAAAVTSAPGYAHRYLVEPGAGATVFELSAFFTAKPPGQQPPPAPFEAARNASAAWWAGYWGSGAFIDLTQGGNASAIEVQRRVILSQYLLAVNEAGHDPPQESGLTNNGWYGKFHLEMVVWHLGHWGLWGRFDIQDRSTGVYLRFLNSSFARAGKQGYAGARFGKMSDPTGGSAPGEINSLLIWQQPHPMFFAETEYQAKGDAATLEKWDAVITAAADFMVSYAWWNTTTDVYDLGPPMYPASENTNPNTTMNPVFELAYWQFALRVAQDWKARQNKTAPASWGSVAAQLAPLPVHNGTYIICEGLDDMWNDTQYTSNHPALIGVYGLIPPPVPPLAFDVSVLRATLGRVYATWNLTESYGWDFPMLAMTSARLGDGETAVEMLLHPAFSFDDVGMPTGGTRVPAPYFPSSGGLLMAVAMMAAGWHGPAEGTTLESRWPAGWTVVAEGFEKGL